LSINENNLNGLGDSVSISYANTDGSNEVDFSYRLPVNARNGTVNLGYTTTFSNIIERPFNAVDIDSRSTNYEIGFRQPLVQSPTREFAVGISAVRRESETTLLGTPFPLSIGADDNGKTRVHALRLFQEYTQRSAREVFAARSQFSIGLDVFDSTINKNSPDGRFLAWRGQAQYLRLLAPDTTLLVRSDMQLTPDKLLPMEQFGLGGLDSVRGYRQDLLLSDNGILASAEVRYPIYRVPKQGLVLQIVPFFDVGSSWNNSKTKIDPSTLFSLGVGLRLQQGDRFTARFDYGIPLVDTSTKARTWQENGLYFSVQYNLF
jgi:hemolysin activation/secretion protein